MRKGVKGVKRYILAFLATPFLKGVKRCILAFLATPFLKGVL